MKYQNSLNSQTIMNSQTIQTITNSQTIMNYLFRRQVMLENAYKA